MTDFNAKFNVNELLKNLEEVQQNAPEFKEIPVGKYEIKIEKLELKENKNGAPMCAGMFRIVDKGEFDGQCLFYNQTLIGTEKDTGKTTVFGLHMNNEFLKVLDTGLDIRFEDFNQYDDLLKAVAREAKKLTYLIEYSKKGDFPSYKVKEIYED